MALRDVTSVIFDRGNGPFNEAAALEAYHLVMKMDDDTAAEFIHHVVNEVVEKTIVDNRDLVQKHLDRTIAKSLVYSDLDAMAEGLSAEERQEVKKQLLAAVSKADEPSDAQKEAWSHRDAHGRFSSFDPNGAVDAKQAANLRERGVKIPDHPTDWGTMTPEQKNRYRHQYLQVAQRIDEMGGFNGNNDVILHYDDGSSKKISAVSRQSVAREINPHVADIDVNGVTVQPYKPSIGGRVTDLTGSLGRTVSGPGGNKDPYARGGESGFVEQWNSAHPTNSTQQMYNRIGAGSHLIEQSGIGGEKMKLAAKFGSHVGQHGSQAEAVFGPPVRRMAYRYRGTERRPTRDLATQYGNAIHSAKTQSGAHTHAENVQRPPNWQERQAGRDVIIGWLQEEGRATNRQLTDLQLAAGHTPPSEGVLLNADGQIVTTAVGSADDWYVPFNLKHLSQLKGGEYIRSRTTGGLTPEDIYTGLMTGARRVTVVSRSGVFSVEFDPELRGGRRNNDKALRMTQRYNELLDAVQSGSVRRHSLDPEVARNIRAEVNDPNGRYASYTAEERRKKVDSLIQERTENPESIQGDIDETNEHWDRIGRTRELTRDERVQRKEQLARLESEKEYFWHLNGLGYQAAQDALQEQFPYYLTSRRRGIYEKTDVVGGHDKGYVEPGALRPSAARANLFGGAPGSGKEQLGRMSARTADHAKPMVDRYGGSKDAPAADRESENPKKPSGGSGSGVGEGLSREQRLAAHNQKQDAIDAASKVHSQMRWVYDLKDENGKPFHESLDSFKEAKRYADMKEPGQFEALMNQPGELEKFRTAMKAAKAQDTSGKFEVPGLDELDQKMGGQVEGDYSYAKAVAKPEALYSFTPNAEASDLAGKMPLAVTGKPASEATDGQLANEAKLWALVERNRSDKSIPDEDKREFLENDLKRAGLTPADPDLLSGSKDDVERRLMAVQRVRFDRNQPKLALGQKVPESVEVQAHGQRLDRGDKPNTGPRAIKPYWMS